jgi:hypothetical protein
VRYDPIDVESSVGAYDVATAAGNDWERLGMNGDEFGSDLKWFETTLKDN